MLRFGIAGSLMSLGAIDFGLVVDSSVILVENAERRLAEDGVLADGTPYLLIGIYLERFVQEADGRWRFAWRRFQPLYSGPHDLSGNFVDVPDDGLPPRAGE